MTFSKFQEYLDTKGKLQEKPIVNLLANTTSDGPKRPEAAVLQGKDWTAEAAAVKDKPVPYSAPGTDPGQPKYEKGFAYDGPKDLVYDPDTTDQRLMKTWPKSEMEKYHMETKNMNTSDFMKYIKEKQNINDKDLTSVTEMAKTLSENSYLMQHFIREIKRNKALANLVQETFAHSESFDELAYLMVNENVCRSFAKALNEIVDEPIKGIHKKRKKRPEDLEKLQQTQSIQGNPMDMGTDDVNTSRAAMVQPEHNLMKALARYEHLAKAMNEISHNK